MDAFPIGEFFEWLHEAIERRWGKVWAWTIYTTLVLGFFVGVAWYLAPG